MKGLLKRVVDLEARARDTSLAPLSDDELEVMLLETVAALSCPAELTGAIAAQDWPAAIRHLEAMECEVS